MQISIPSAPSRDLSGDRSRYSRNSASEPSGGEGETPAPPSLWLYLAGLCVTLAGLYAVNFGMEDSGFATMTYTLAVFGYLTSYLMRSRGIPSQTLQVPLAVILGLIVFQGLTGDHGFSFLLPSGMAEEGFRSLPLLLLWVSIAHTFLLGNDAAVLFACVPSMSMLAIVSTTNSDVSIQNAFVLFVGAATFLMVHENYLRTQQAAQSGRVENPTRGLFGGQLLLTATCIAGALALANIVAVPIQGLGQGITDSGALSAFQPNPTRQTHNTASSVPINEASSVSLGVGPQTESDTPLLKIRSERGLYWRGTTFNFYTGRAFTNDRTRPLTNLQPETVPEPSGPDQRRRFDDMPTDAASHPEVNRFRVPSSELDGPGELKGSQETRQEVTVIGGSFTVLYGAATMQRVETNDSTLHFDANGSVLTDSPLAQNSTYNVISRVPTDDPGLLRQASSNRADIPRIVEAAYLQTPSSDSPTSQTLLNLTSAITHGLTNNYDKAQAIKTYISSHCKYNLQAAAVPANQDVVEYFLTQSREGYCDSFGAAMTMLCRYAGIPARLCSGFLSGTLQKDGSYLVQEKHKHLWAEVFFPQYGWVPFDATEDTEDISVHGTSVTIRAGGFFQWLRLNGALPQLLGLTVGVLILYVLMTELRDRVRPRTHRVRTAGPERPETNLAIVAVYAMAHRLLAKRGLERKASLTPEEHLALLRERSEPLPEDLLTAMTALTGGYSRFRYGNETATADDVQAAKRQLILVKTALSHYREVKPERGRKLRTQSASSVAAQ